MTNFYLKKTIKLHCGKEFDEFYEFLTTEYPSKLPTYFNIDLSDILPENKRFLFRMLNARMKRDYISEEAADEAYNLILFSQLSPKREAC